MKCKPGDAFVGETIVFVDGDARVVTPDYDDGFPSVGLEALKEIAAKESRGGFALTAEKRARRHDDGKRDRRGLKLGCLIPIEGLGKIRVSLSGKDGHYDFHLEPL